jgi:hypothetical protein
MVTDIDEVPKDTGAMVVSYIKKFSGVIETISQKEAM